MPPKAVLQKAAARRPAAPKSAPSRKPSWDENAATALRTVITNKQLGVDELICLFRACTIGRDAVLQAAEQARLTIQLPSTVVAQKLLATAQRRLETRSGLPTDLAYVCRRGADLSQLPGYTLQDPSVQALRVVFMSSCQPIDNEQFAGCLQRTVVAFPGIYRLAVDSQVPCALPNPDTLNPDTRVTHLDLKAASGNDQLLHSAVGYLPKLDYLKMAARYEREVDQLDTIFQAGGCPYTRLATLVIDRTLTSVDINVIQSAFPHLAKLQCKGLKLTPGAHEGQKWRVPQFCIDGKHVEQLVHLPASTAGPLQVHCTSDVLEILAQKQGIVPEFQARLADYHFITKTIKLKNKHGNQAEDQYVAIAYTQLSQLHAPNATLHVDYATHAAVAALANALPTLPSNIKLAIGHLLDLDDANMTHLLRMGQRVSVHECEGIIVQSDQYVNSPWLLPKFHLDSMYVGASFAKLPLPGLVDGKAPRVTYHYLNFSKLPLLSEVELDRIAQWLAHAHWRPKTWRRTDPSLTPAQLDTWRVQVVGYQETTCTAAQLAQRLQLLTPLAAAISRTHPTHPTNIYLGELKLTQDTMASLAHLPAVKGTLDLSSCQFPLKPSEYLQSAQLLPTTFTAYEFGYGEPVTLGTKRSGEYQDRLSRATAFLEGVNMQRAKEKKKLIKAELGSKVESPGEVAFRKNIRCLAPYKPEGEWVYEDDSE